MPIQVSIIIPCLNEVRTLAACITSARQLADACRCETEIIVVDNGSTDGSAELAGSLNVRVVAEVQRGYGHALLAGFRQAHGDVIVMADGDDTYDFTDALPMVTALQAGRCVIAIGTRLRGRIDPGAMPWLHRSIGTPVLTWLCNRLYGTKISDINCGLRACLRSWTEQAQLRCGGMEFATEMIVLGARQHMGISEFPVHLRAALPDRTSHLHPLRDGWRHLRLLLHYRFMRQADHG